MYNTVISMVGERNSSGYFSVFFVLLLMSGVLNPISAAAESENSSNSETFKITGKVIPADSVLVTCCSSSPPDFNRTTGKFTFYGLEPKDYTFSFSHEGYESRLVIVSVVDSDVAMGSVYLYRIGEAPDTYNVTVGPFVDENRSCIEGVKVFFSMENGERFQESTNELGNATFALPLEFIPQGLNVSARYGSRTVSWKWYVESPPYSSFTRALGKADENDDTAGPDDADDGSNEKGSNMNLILLVLIILLMICVLWVGIMIRKFVKMKK